MRIMRYLFVDQVYLVVYAKLYSMVSFDTNFLEDIQTKIIFTFNSLHLSFI